MDLHVLPVRQIAGAADALLQLPESLLAQECGGDGWTRDQHMLALIVDELRTANWQRSKDGMKNRNRPKPISPLAAKGRRIGRTTRSPAEVAAYLASVGPRADEEVGSG